MARQFFEKERITPGTLDDIFQIAASQCIRNTVLEKADAFGSREGCESDFFDA